MSKGYNGWKNKSTYLCNLWFPNFDESAQAIFDGLDSCWSWPERDLKNEFIFRLANYIENTIEQEYLQFAGRDRANMFCDILSSIITDDIDYKGIACHYWESINKSEYVKYNSCSDEE
jgi:hypothetical protein